MIGKRGVMLPVLGRGALHSLLRLSMALLLFALWVASISTAAEDPAEHTVGRVAVIFANSFETPLPCASTLNAVVDGCFEDGAVAGAWFDSSTNFDSLICDLESCNTPGGTGPRSGVHWAWLGGAQAAETSILSQVVNFPPETLPEVTFWLRMPEADTTGSMQVRFNGLPVWQTTAGSMTYTQEHVLLSGGWPPSGNHLLEFVVTTNGGGPLSFFVDDVEISTGQSLICPDPPAHGLAEDNPDWGGFVLFELGAMSSNLTLAQNKFKKIQNLIPIEPLTNSTIQFSSTGTPARMVIAISRCPGDFGDFLPNDNPSCLAQTDPTGFGGIRYRSSDVPPDLPACVLDLGGIYFLNVVNAVDRNLINMTSCPDPFCVFSVEDL